MHFYASAILVVIAAVHCLRRGGGGWLWIILFGGPFGAAAYFIVEVFGWVNLGGGGGHFRATPLKVPDLREAQTEVTRLGNAHAYGQLAAALHGRGKHAEAVDAAQQALARDASDVGTRYLLGRSLAALNRPAEAAVELQQVVAASASHDFGTAALALAEARRRAGDTAGALAACRTAAPATSRPDLMFHLAGIFAALGEKAEARELLERLVHEAAFAPEFARRDANRWARKAQAELRTLPA